MENRHKIAKHNVLYQKGEKSYELAMNHFGDLVSLPSLYLLVDLLSDFFVL